MKSDGPEIFITSDKHIITTEEIQDTTDESIIISDEMNCCVIQEVVFLYSRISTV